MRCILALAFSLLLASPVLCGGKKGTPQDGGSRIDPAVPKPSGGVCHEFGYSNGIFPHPYDCGQYVVCTNGHTAELQCPSSGILSSCRSSADNCDGTQVGPVPHPHHDEPEQEGEHGFHPRYRGVCQEQGFWNGVFPHPSKCNTYVQCTSGSTELVSCPSETILNVCGDAGFEVDCDGDGNGNWGSYLGELTYCKDNGLWSGNYADPDNCEGFISCSNGLSTRMYCPPGTAFNSAHGDCVFGDYSDCYGDGDLHFGRNYYHGRHHGSDGNRGGNDGNRGGNDGNRGGNDGGNRVDKELTYCKDNGLWSGNYADPDNCEGFISCSNGLSTRMYCPPGTAFNSAHGDCVFGDYSDCYGDGGLHFGRNHGPNVNHGGSSTNGNKGSDGNNDNQGNKGNQGNNGNQGSNGNHGNQGNNNNNGFGKSGSTGDDHWGPRSDGN